MFKCPTEKADRRPHQPQRARQQKSKSQKLHDSKFEALRPRLLKTQRGLIQLETPKIRRLHKENRQTNPPRLLPKRNLRRTRLRQSSRKNPRRICKAELPPAANRNARPNDRRRNQNRRIAFLYEPNSARPAAKSPEPRRLESQKRRFCCFLCSNAADSPMHG